MVALKYVSNFLRAFVYNLVCNFFYTSWYCCKSIPIFATINIKHYVLVLTLSTQGNAKLLEQLESGLKEKLTGIDIN